MATADRPSWPEIRSRACSSRRSGGRTTSVKMPPKKRLADEVVADFASGSPPAPVWPAERKPASAPRRRPARRHWAFETVEGRRATARPDRLVERPIDRFIAAHSTGGRARARAPADRRTLIRRVTFDLIGLPPTPEEIADFLPTIRPMRSPASSTDCSPRLITASAGDGTGWTSSATPTRPATMPTIPSRRPPATATTSSTRSTATSPTTEFVREQLAGDILAGRGRPDHYAELDRRHRVPGPVAPVRDRPVRALASHARGHDRDDRPRLPRA